MSKQLFPLASKYDQNWVEENSLLHNTLYYAESLCNALEVQESMSVLDLGCGKAISSIFLAKEFGPLVFAVDREVSPSKNLTRIMQFDVLKKVVPLKVDAKNLPFPNQYFDLVISIDSFSYYGTDDWYIPYISQFIKPGGRIAISEWCFTKEFKSMSDVPDYLHRCYQDIGLHCMHSIGWWKHHFEKTGLFKVEIAEILPESDFLLADYINQFQNVESERLIVEALKKDKQKVVSAFRLVAKRTKKVAYLDDFDDK